MPVTDPIHLLALYQGAEAFEKVVTEGLAKVRVVLLPAEALALLYAIVWVVCWRGRPYRGRDHPEPNQPLGNRPSKPAPGLATVHPMIVLLESAWGLYR